ncbi:MAG: ribbon-helix-helix domain-containing protein [Beijerinckiaceae bacterium]
MCKMFSGQSPELYESHTRSIRLGGHATSIRLEAAFWTILEEIAAEQGVSMPRFLTKLHDEVLDFRGEIINFTSLLRCACLTYMSEVKGRDAAANALKAEASTAFGGAPPRAGTPLHRQDL